MGVNRTFSESAGVTLIELMIASGILAIAFVLMLGGIISINQTNAITENQAHASAHLESVIEEIQGLSLEQLLAYQPPVLPGLGAASSIQMTCLDSTGTSVPLPIDPAALSSPIPNPAEVQVSVLWSDVQGRLYTARTSTFCRR